MSSLQAMLLGSRIGVQSQRAKAIAPPRLRRTWRCLNEIAKAERVGPSFVSRVIRLGLLARAIVEAILAGKCPAPLTLKNSVEPFLVEWLRRWLKFGIGKTS